MQIINLMPKDWSDSWTVGRRKHKFLYDKALNFNTVTTRIGSKAIVIPAMNVDCDPIENT